MICERVQIACADFKSLAQIYKSFAQVLNRLCKFLGHLCKFQIACADFQIVCANFKLLAQISNRLRSFLSRRCDVPGMTKSLQRLIHQAEELVTNGQSSQEIVTRMADYGYDAARWAEGQALLDAVKEKVLANEASFAVQLGKTDVFRAAFDKAWDQSQSLGLLCAELFKGRTGVLSLLGLHKKRDERTGESRVARPRTRSTIDFMGWARNLYAVAQEREEIAAVLADFGYPAGRLSAEAADVEAMVQANSEQETAKVNARQSTADRDEAARELKTWLRRARTVAKLALEGDRELLELVGLRGRRR